MDPGNWATDLDATRFGYGLLWAVVASGVGAVLLQLLVVRLTAAGGDDLAGAIARRWPRAASWLWPLYAVAIVATELAEFTGLVVGIQLVGNVAAPTALALGAAAFFALLLTGATASRRLERFAILSTVLLAAAYAIDLVLLHPAPGPIVRGLVPSLPGVGALAAILGIVGATIMPHNLFLHGGLVRERLTGSKGGARRALVRRLCIETALALTIATAVNASILIVRRAVGATTVEHAFATLVPVAGHGAALLFGAALIVAALAATATGACAGDVVCGAHAPVRLDPFVRRVLAVAPAVALLATGCSPTVLLVASQVALGLILPAVVVPMLLLLRPVGSRSLLVNK